MGVLTHRAEQGVLGAMLRDPGQAAMLGYLESGDFASNRHRMVRDAIMAASRSAARTGLGWRSRVEMAAGPEISAEYLDELEAACPDPGHGPAYAAMVLEASVRRSLLGHAEDLASQAETLGYDAERLARAAGGDDRRGERYALHMAWIATAMRGHAAQFDPDTTPAAAEPSSEGSEEEQIVLGALIQGHRESAQVVSMLPTAAFTGLLRREIFQAIRTLRSSGRPVDELIVDWEVARNHMRHESQPPNEESVVDDQPSYVSRLAVIALGTGAPIARAAIILLENLAGRVNGQHFPVDATAPRLGAAVHLSTDNGQSSQPVQRPPHLPELGHGHVPHM
jgi:hypothetical protein